MKASIALYALIGLISLCARPVHCCADEENFDFKGHDNFCDWLHPKKLKVKRKHCTLPLVGRKCPDACLHCSTPKSCEDTNFCCQNVATFTFKTNKGETAWCGWLTNKKRRGAYCNKVTDTGVMIRDKCRGVCGNCRDRVNPTQSPTRSLSPTPLPSPLPSPLPWSFIVLADWHKAEYFATDPSTNSQYYKETESQIKFVNQTYGGDFVLIPGDTNGALPGEKGGGKWDKEDFETIFEPELTVSNRVLKAGKNCYKSVKELFSRGGYDTIYVALGDHEVGGNSWGIANTRKINALTAYKTAFSKWYNNDADKNFLFPERIGSVSSRPLGTEFADTSYAHQHKNMLTITVDAFKQMSTTFIDKERGAGGEGAITCTLDGEHLEWFINVLIEAKKDASIKFIIVQAHVPIIQPVRQVASSGQFMDYGEESDLWKAMADYGVDIYFGGDVHDNTVTKDPNSDLLQVVSRGNQFSNFLKVDVTDSILSITAYNEVGIKRMNNKKYIEHGSLTLDKSNCAASACDCAIISAHGVLKLLDRTSALVHFNFGEIIPLGTRQVIGLQHDDHFDTLVAKRITIRRIKSEESLPNQGSFGQQYDAQIANVNLSWSSSRNDSYATFTERSRLGIFTNGPHTSGGIISYALWIKTSEISEMTLVHYGNAFDFNAQKKMKRNIFTLTLKNGSPILYSSPQQILEPVDAFNLNDNEWHHIAVSMPRRSCLLSEVVMYVDGRVAATKTPQRDTRIFFISSGRMSIGGFGHSSEKFEIALPHLSNFVGGVDDFFLWTRKIEEEDLSAMGV